MNDKLQQLYDLYKQKGIINTTDFNTFATANDAQRQKLYDLGVQKGLFNTTDYNTFNTAWGGSQQEPLKKKEPTVSASNLEKPTSASSSKRRFEGVTEEPISQKKFRTDDYIDQVQNAQKKPSATNQKVESTFEQPKETKPTIKFDALSDKEAMQMMAEDFGKKEFELYSKISDIDPNVFGKGKESTVDYLNNKFKGSGFVFEKGVVGESGNSIIIKSTLNDGFGTVVNEKVVELPTERALSIGGFNEEEAKNAQKEISDFMNQAFLKKSEKEFLNEDVKDYGQLVKLAVNNPQKYGKGFLNEYDSERWLDKQYLDLVIEGKSIQREKQTLQSEIDAYQQSGVRNEETERLIRSRQANLQNQIEANTTKYEELKDISTKLPKAAAVYFQNKEKQGNTLGLITRSLSSGLMNMEKALITTAADVAPLLIPSEYMIPEVQQVRLKAAGMTDAQIKDYAAKQLREGVVKDALKAVDDLVSFGTTEEYVQSGDRNDLEKVASFLAESIGTAISGGGNPLLTKLAFFSQSYNAIEDEMNSPEFDSMSQMEKKIMSVPYGIVIGALDRLGFKLSTGIAKNAMFNKLITNTIANAFTSIPKNASIEVMQQAISESLKATMAKTGLEIVGGALVEGATEGTQSLAEYGMKNLYNNFVADKDVFQGVPDITTKEGFEKALGAAKEEAYYGTLGGFIMASGSTALQSISKGFNKGAEEFDFFSSVIEDPNLRALIETDIKTKITSGKITKAQAAEQIDAINKSVSILNQMPTDMSSDKKMEAYNLILEKNKIDKDIDGKDPNLVKPQTERVGEINNRLQEIAKENAVQEQSADAVSVQSGTGVSTEVETGVSKTEPQGVTGETITEEVEVEGTKAEQPQAEVAQEIVQSEENQSLIDDYVQRQTEFINSATVISQEEKQQRIQELEADPVAFAEKNASVTEIEGETPHTDLLNSLQRQPAAETATTEKLTVNPSEGYSFEYESENDVPAELKGVEPTGRTETKVGRGKKAKTKLKLTFTGQQLIDAGLAVTPEAQPTAQAQPTAKIENIEVTEVPAAEETISEVERQNNILTAEDFSEVNLSDKKSNKVAAQIVRAAKAISNVLPKVKFVVHSTPEAFVEGTKDLDGRASEGGIYDHNTKTIHINLKAANSRTVAHEVFHALILSKVASDAEARKLTRSMVKAVIKSLKQAEGGAEIISFLEDFESNYEANIQNEEKLSELFAILSDNYKSLPPATKNIIVRFLERMAKLVGIKPMTSNEITEFMNVLSAKVEAGEVISKKEVGKQKDGAVSETRKQIIGEVGAKKLDQGEKSNLRMDNLKVAKDMKDAGETPKQIRNATGWEMGAEGKWRYETVDNLPFFNDVVNKVRDLIDTKLNQYPLLGISDKAIVSEKASDIVPSELTKMYPELNDYTIDFGIENENKGSIDVDDKKIRVNVGKNPINTVKVLLHEVQHAIQEIEGFDSGTSAQKIIDQFIAQDNAFKNKINRIRKYSPDNPLLDAVRNNRKAFIDNFSTVNKNNEKILNGVNLYMRKAGEIEANNVETRMNMTEEERRNTLLTETESVKDRQIIEDRVTGKFAVRKQKGLINLTDQEAVKYARAGVENKYDAQAIKQIGLQGTKFDKKSILDRIQKEFDGLVKNTKDYIFREDSPAIDQAIQNEIDTMVDQGFSNDQIERAKRAFKPGPERDNVINEYRRAQVETVNQWESYLGQSEYTPAFKYLMLDAVLTNNYDLKSDRYQKRTAKTIRNFTPFDAGTLAELYMSESNELLKDYVRIQADNSANIVESAAFSSTKDGKWIKFDGGKNLDDKELQDNANKLSQLVQNTYWCTKTNALSQLRGGDFYVYVTENKQGDFDPRIAVRMDGDKVGEVRGNASSKQDLEADMLPVADTFLREKIPNDSGKKWLDSIAYNTKVKDLTDKIDTKVLNMDDVMDYIDILKDKSKFSVDYGENGLVQTLQDKFRDAKFSFGVANSKADIKDDTLLLIKQNPFSSWTIDSNEQIKNVQVIIGNVIAYDNFDGGKVKAISGSLEFDSDSSAKEINSIEYIGGNVNFKVSNIINLGSLKEIGGRATFKDSKVLDLGNLKIIGDIADFRRSNVNSLANLELVGRSLWLRDSKVDDLGNLKEVGRDALFQDSRVTTLNKLKKIGGDVDFEFSEVEDLGDLEFVGGDFLAEGKNNKLKTLSNLKKVGGSLNIGFESKIEDLGDLTEVGKNFFAPKNKNLKNLGKLKSVGYSSYSGGILDISDTSVTDLGNLEKIKGTAFLDKTKIKSLGKLKIIEGNAATLFMSSNIEDLGDLELIGGNVKFWNSKIKSLGKLKEIKGDADFNNSNVEDLGALESIGGAIGFQGKPELKEQWEQRQGQKFEPRKQKNSVDRLVNEEKKKGKTDQEIRDEAKAAGFSAKEASNALAKYYAKEEGVFVRSGKTGITTKLYEGAKKFKEQYLKSKGLLPKIGFFLKEKMEGEISKETNRAVKTARKFGKMFEDFNGDKDLLLDSFDKFLRGDTTVKLPRKFAAVANEMRNHIDTLSKMLINVGAVEGDIADIVSGNIGAYLTRSYEIYDNKNWRDDVAKETIVQAKNFLRSQQGMIAMATDEAAQKNITVDEALDILVDNAIDDIFTKTEVKSLVSGQKLGSKDLSTLKEREDIPEQIRMLMGEYSDPAMNYARTVNSLIHLGARHKFLTDIRKAGLGRFFFEKNDAARPTGFNAQISAEGSKVMAPLNGLYTTPEIVQAFDQEFGEKETNKAMKLFYGAMGLVKWLKTIASLATHAKNVVSNLGFVMVNGHNITKLYDAFKVVKDDLKVMSDADIQKRIDEYIEAGIMRQGAGINEIRDMFKDANLDKYLERRLSNKKSKGMLGRMGQYLMTKGISTKIGLENAYQAEDDLFKIAAYENEVSRYANALYGKKPQNLTPDEKTEVSNIAAENVKNTYPTYSRIPEGIKRMRKIPLFVGSFISFQAESYRTAFNTIALAKDELSSDNKKIKAIGATRVAGATAYLGVKTAMLSYFGMAFGTGLSGVIGYLFDDDDEKEKEKDLKEFLPSWSKNSDIIVKKNTDGTIEYIDFSASDPHGGINKALNAFFSGDDLLDSFTKSVLGVVEQFQGPDITVQLAMQIYNNADQYGNKIYNPEDTFANNSKKITDYIYDVIEPGTLTSTRKLIKEEDTKNVIIGELTGMKTRKIDVKQQFGFKLAEFDESFKDIKKVYNSEYYKTVRMMEDPKSTKKEIEEQKEKTKKAYENANALYNVKTQEMMKLINSANKLGVDYDAIMEEVKARKVINQYNLFEIEQGRPAIIEEKPY